MCYCRKSSPEPLTGEAGSALVRRCLFFYSFFFGLFVPLLGCGGIIIQGPLDVAVNTHSKDVFLPILGANGGYTDALVALLGAI